MKVDDYINKLNRKNATQGRGTFTYKDLDSYKKITKS